MFTQQDQTDLRNIEKKVLKECEDGLIPCLWRENSPTSDFTTNEVSIHGNILDSDFTFTFFDKQGESDEILESIFKQMKSSKQRLEWLMMKAQQERIDRYNELMNGKEE